MKSTGVLQAVCPQFWDEKGTGILKGPAGRLGAAGAAARGREASTLVRFLP